MSFLISLEWLCPSFSTAMGLVTGQSWRCDQHGSEGKGASTPVHRFYCSETVTQTPAKVPRENVRVQPESSPVVHRLPLNRFPHKQEDYGQQPWAGLACAGTGREPFQVHVLRGWGLTVERKGPVLAGVLCSPQCRPLLSQTRRAPTQALSSFPFFTPPLPAVLLPAKSLPVAIWRRTQARSYWLC